MSSKALMKREWRIRRNYRPVIDEHYSDLPFQNLTRNPTSSFSENVQNYFSLYAQYLKDSLIYGQQIVLIPAPAKTHRGHKIRVCVTPNPLWYSYLVSITDSDCSRAVTKSRIKLALTRLENNTDKKRISAPAKNDKSFGQYSLDQLLRDMSAQHLCRGYYDDLQDMRISPINEVREFFGLDEIYIEDDSFWRFYFNNQQQEECPF